MNAQAKTPLNVYYIEVDYIKALAPYIIEVQKCFERIHAEVKKSDFPLLDFRVFRLKRKLHPKQQFKTCVNACV